RSLVGGSGGCGTVSSVGAATIKEGAAALLANARGSASKDGSDEPVADAPGSDMQLHFAVRDTGIGIASDKLGAVFEPFVQADGSTTRKYGGTGLGLTISSHLVGMMEGRIWIESEVGQGSTFHFTVSLGVQEEPHTIVPDEVLKRLRDLPVLVVDDNATSRRVLEEWLWQLNM